MFVFDCPFRGDVIVQPATFGLVVQDLRGGVRRGNMAEWHASACVGRATYGGRGILLLRPQKILAQRTDTVLFGVAIIASVDPNVSSRLRV